MAKLGRVVFDGMAGEAKPATMPNGADIPLGSKFVEADTGREYVWNGAAWHEPADAPPEVTLADLLLELRAIRTGIEMQIALGHPGVHVDLLTETVTEVR